MRRNPAVLFTLATLSLCSLSVPLPAQDDDGETHRHGIFVETLDVTLVDLRVVATDRAGEPVLDLERSDFTVLDDGEEVEISHFQRVASGRPAATAGDDVAPPPATAGDDPRTAVIVLVDDDFLAPASRGRVFALLETRLDELLVGGARVMLARKDRAIEVEQRLTGDRDELVAALERLARRTGSASLDGSAGAQILRQIEHGLPPGAASEPLDGRGGGIDVARSDAITSYGRARSHAAELAQKVRTSTAAVRGFLGSLAGVPGRKILLWVADELPTRPGERLLAVWFDKYGRDYADDVGISSVRSAIQEFDVDAELRALAAEASAAGVVIYALGDAAGSAPRSISAETDSGALDVGFAAQGVRPESEGLRFLARATGGAAAAATSAAGWLLERLAGDAASYYSLAYPTPHAGDGEIHRVEVRVDRPGVELRYLESYRAKNAEQQMVDRTVAALYLERVANPLDVRLSLGAGERQRDGSYLVPLEIRFPIAGLTLLPAGDAHRGELSIYLAVRDEAGRLSPPRRIPVPLVIPNGELAAALSQLAGYTTTLRMRRGEQRLAVGVRDDLGAKSSAVVESLRLGRVKGRGAG